MFKKLVPALLASSLVFSAASVGAVGEVAYIRIIGQKTDAKSGLREKGREDMIQVSTISHTIVSPRDPQSGLPTGQRMHKPFVIQKELDKTSPALHGMLSTNENISSATLKVWAPSAAGGLVREGEMPVYTVKLTNANIASMELRMIKGADGKDRLYEEIAFTYQKIEWTWAGSPPVTDDWTARQ